MHGEHNDEKISYFGGKKSIIWREEQILGGKNTFLAGKYSRIWREVKPFGGK